MSQEDSDRQQDEFWWSQQYKNRESPLSEKFKNSNPRVRGDILSSLEEAMIRAERVSSEGLQGEHELLGDLRSDYSAVLRELRIKKGVDIVDIGRDSGVSRRTYYRLEGDSKENPRPKTMRLLADYFEVPLSSFYTNSAQASGSNPQT